MVADQQGVADTSRSSIKASTWPNQSQPYLQPMPVWRAARSLAALHRGHRCSAVQHSPWAHRAAVQCSTAHGRTAGSVRSDGIQRWVDRLARLVPERWPVCLLAALVHGRPTRFTPTRRPSLRAACLLVARSRGLADGRRHAQLVSIMGSPYHEQRALCLRSVTGLPSCTTQSLTVGTTHLAATQR